MTMVWLYINWCHSIRLHADQKIWSRPNIWYFQSSVMGQSIAAVMNLDLSWNWRAIPASQLSWWVVGNYDNWRSLDCIILRDISFNWQLDKQALRSLELEKVLFNILILCQSVDTWRCNAHDYCLREARWLINHIFDMQRSLHFFSYILMTPPWNVCVHLR